MRTFLRICLTLVLIMVVLGTLTTRTAIFSLASSAWACIASCTSLPLASRM